MYKDVRSSAMAMKPKGYGKRLYNSGKEGRAHVTDDVINQARITLLDPSQATEHVLHCASSKSNRILHFHRYHS